MSARMKTERIFLELISPDLAGSNFWFKPGKLVQNQVFVEVNPPLKVTPSPCVAKKTQLMTYCKMCIHGYIHLSTFLCFPLLLSMAGNSLKV